MDGLGFTKGIHPKADSKRTDAKQIQVEIIPSPGIGCRARLGVADV